VASRQREHVTGQRFAPNSLRKAQMILLCASAGQIQTCRDETLGGRFSMRTACSAFLIVCAVLAADWSDWRSDVRTVRFRMLDAVLPAVAQQSRLSRSERP